MRTYVGGGTGSGDWRRRRDGWATGSHAPPPQGLRLNRALLWLSLAHNRIQDQGALKLAEVGAAAGQRLGFPPAGV